MSVLRVACCVLRVASFVTIILFINHLLQLVTRGEFIIVGDLMKSINVYVYKPLENAIEEIAKDYNSNWMNAVCLLSSALLPFCSLLILTHSHSPICRSRHLMTTPLSGRRIR